MISNEKLDQIVAHLVRAKQHATQSAVAKAQAEAEASALQREEIAYSSGAYDVLNYVKMLLAEDIKP